MQLEAEAHRLHQSQLLRRLDQLCKPPEPLTDTPQGLKAGKLPLLLFYMRYFNDKNRKKMNRLKQMIDVLLLKSQWT